MYSDTIPMAARNRSYILARIKVEVDVSDVSVVEDEGTPGLKLQHGVEVGELNLRKVR